MSAELSRLTEAAPGLTGEYSGLAGDAVAGFERPLGGLLDPKGAETPPNRLLGPCPIDGGA